ncbi:hypothetical protein [Comamonas testosteroni]|uniref:Uncharacterized protein n=1 Tax=Comamonas testosteroni TaxID=285 RepID=A0A8B4S4H9_COMTE|nr:hypothetical protein [Comamonas testosteroni]EHN65603.1 hypothetical protein CTATCC11996_10038 [Comamonas testosteroni ATCC 11996]QQN68374.1 hypothetical protein IYN88_16510 [Comamonas testosteroni]SUY78369.1 Uncharacterised protein [Comamonas testosteroni]
MLNTLNTLVPATEFEICVSMVDLAVWPEDDDLPVCQHPELKALFDALEANIDLLPLVIKYFENNMRAGQGDLYVFEFDEDNSTVVALDTYSDITDQLDLVSLFVRCTKEKRSEVSLCVQRLFNAASVQVQASQKSICTRLREVIDPLNYPRTHPGSSFVQLQVRCPAVIPPR